MKIQTISPGEPGFDDVNNKVKEQLGMRVDYISLAEEYNRIERDSILLLKLVPTLKLANIATVIKRKGLVRGQDYAMARIKRDSNGVPIPVDLRPVAIKKLTKQVMGSVIAGN
jgi:hypothetical protein